MTKNINELPGDQLKKAKAPTLTEQVKNLQERVHEIEQREGSQDDEAVAKMITEALDRYCMDKGVVFWGDKRDWPTAERARNAVMATYAEEAGTAKGPLTKPIIFGALLGAVLALGVLAICNPAAFRRPLNLPAIAISGPAVTPPEPLNTLGLDKNSSATTTDWEKQLAVANQAETGSSISARVIVGASNCWMRVTDGATEGGRIRFEGYVSNPGRTGWIDSIGAGGVTVRSGCPGKVEYFVDGNQRYPENHSGTPEKSEVVTLP
jgi:hypothetical protein